LFVWRDLRIASKRPAVGSVCSRRCSVVCACVLCVTGNTSTYLYRYKSKETALIRIWSTLFRYAVCRITDYFGWILSWIVCSLDRHRQNSLRWKWKMRDSLQQTIKNAVARLYRCFQANWVTSRELRDNGDKPHDAFL
jgi:hypothetical protein